MTIFPNLSKSTIDLTRIKMKKYKFSIVIAIGPGRKAEVIRSLETLDYPVREYEVFLENGINPSENRNRGAKKANGEIIAFIDDDAIVDRKLLRNAEEFFNKYKNIDIVGGPQLTPSYQQGFAKFSGYALASKFGAASASNRYKGSKLILNADETMLTSANLFCRRNVFNKVQFNPNLYPGEDPDFIEKSMKAGFKVAFDSNLIVYHKRRENLSGFVKQIYNYGLSRPKKESLIQTLKHASFIVPSIFLVYLVLLPIL